MRFRQLHIQVNFSCYDNTGLTCNYKLSLVFSRIYKSFLWIPYIILNHYRDSTLIQTSLSCHNPRS
jgi:hypothetical protein